MNKYISWLALFSGIATWVMTGSAHLTRTYSTGFYVLFILTLILAIMATIAGHSSQRSVQGRIGYFLGLLFLVFLAGGILIKLIDKL
jgi:H+/gluconate symporter-like permease